MPEQSKFENVDLFASLEAIMKQNTGRGSHIPASASCSFFAYLTFPFSISSSGNCGRASISFFVIDWRISSLRICFYQV